MSQIILHIVNGTAYDVYLTQLLWGQNLCNTLCKLVTHVLSALMDRNSVYDCIWPREITVLLQNLLALVDRDT